jgi:hypothetical protein
MEQGQINEILKHQKELLSSIDRTIEDGLRDAKLSTAELRKKVLGGLRWGLFLRKGVKNVNSSRTVAFPSDEIGLAPLVRINFHEIMALQKQIKTFGFYKAPIFSDEIDQKFLNREIKVDFCHDTLKSTIVEVLSTFNRPDTTKLLKHFEFKLTLPDAEEVFGIDDESLVDDDTLMQLDAYDEWKFSIEQDYDTYFQIGGNGKWIQNCYSHNYIAQVNNGVGEDGSVYIVFRPNGDFKSIVEMY